MTGFISYYQFTFDGYYHPDTMEIDVWKPTLTTQETLKRSYVDIPKITYPTTAIVQQNGVHTGADPDWDQYCNSYYQTLWKPADGSPGWIGENGGMEIGWFEFARQAVGFPPEPQITLDIDYKEIINGVTKGHSFHRREGSFVPTEIAWKFKNLGRGKGPNETYWWPDYKFQVRTALEERPDTFENNWVYNYLFAKDIGPIMLWWGQRLPEIKDSSGNITQAKNTIKNGNMWQIASRSLF